MHVIHRDVEKTHPLEVDLKNSDVGSEASCHARGVDAGCSPTQHNDTSRQNSRDAAE